MNKNLLIKANIERTEKGMLAIASTSVIDRQGESVSVDGWDIKSFKKNPVLLWGHNHDEPAIGIADKIKVVGVGKKAQLTFEPVFHDKTLFAKAIKTLYEGDETMKPVLNSFSVGFRPIDVDGNTYTKQELLEISAVNVPANPEARVMAYKSLKGAGFADDVIKSVGIDVDKQDKDQVIKELQVEVENLKEQVKSVVNGLKHLNPQGRKEETLTQRMSMLKVIARASDKMLEKESLSAVKRDNLSKVVKRAAERLIVEHKEELKNGKN